MTILTDLPAPIATTRAATTTALVRGGIVALRPLRHGEVAPLLAVFAAMSSESVEQRFMSPIPRLNDSMLARLSDVDGKRHVAWVALLAGEPVGVARAIATGPDTADVAFEVVDSCQRRGVGAVLLDAVTTVALARGITRLQASASADNTASLALLSRVGLRLATSGGVAEGEAPLRLMDPPAVDRAAVLRLAG